MEWRWMWADSGGRMESLQMLAAKNPFLWSRGHIDTVVRELLGRPGQRPVRVRPKGTQAFHEFASPVEAATWLALNVRKLGVRFQVHCGTMPGQHVIVTGSTPELGSWDPLKGIQLETTLDDYPIWKSAELIGPGLLTRFEYKYAVCGQGLAPSFEDGPRRVGDLSAMQSEGSHPGVVTIIDSSVGLTCGPPQARFTPSGRGMSFTKVPAKPNAVAGSFGPANFPRAVWDHRSAAGRAMIDDRYQLGDELGHGSFGCVRIASLKHANTTLWRAVKIVRKSMITDTSDFNREISIMELMDHQNTLRLFEVFEDHGFIYLVLELCKGGNLLEFLMKHRPDGCAEAEAAHLLRQMAAAVEHCHRQQVAHRDVKLENFLVLERDGPVHLRHVKLCDLGLAARVPPEGFTNPCGSMNTVAPEVYTLLSAAAGPPYGLACDLWSLGSVLYSMLAGQLPQGPMTGPAWKQRLREGRVDLASEPWPQVSPEAVHLVRSLMCLDPAARSTAEQCLQHRWLSQEGPNRSFRPAHVSFRSAERMSEGLRRWFGEYRLGHFRKTALHVLAQQDAASAKHRDVFQKLDADKDGQVSLKQLVDALARILPGGEHNPSIVQWRQNILPILPEGAALGQTEFLAATMQADAWWQEDRCWDVFRYLDRDLDGAISLEDLEHLCNEANTKERFTQEIQACGGRITFPIFVQLMRESVQQTSVQPPSSNAAARPPRPKIKNLTIRKEQPRDDEQLEKAQ